MKTILLPRRGGKTTELIKRCAEMGGYIVCMSQREAHCIADMAKKMDLKIPLPITFSEFIERRYYGRGITTFHIDNVDLFIQSLTPVPVATITATQATETEAEYNAGTKEKFMTDIYATWVFQTIP